MSQQLTPPSIDPEAAERDGVFIREYVRTGDERVACVRAGIRDTGYPIEVTARRQLARPEIQAGINALRVLEKNTEPVEVTQATLTADMEDVFTRALAEKKYTDAIAAKKLQAQMHGYLDQNITVTHKNAAEDLTDAELARIVATGKTITVPYTEVSDENAADNAGGSSSGTSEAPKGSLVPR